MASNLTWSLSPHNQDTTNINRMLLTSRVGHHLHVWAQYKKLGMRPHTSWWQTRNGDQWVRKKEGQHSTWAHQPHQPNPIDHQHGMHACRSSSPHNTDARVRACGGMSWPHGHAGLVGDEGHCCLVVGASGGGQDHTIVGSQLALRSCRCRCQGGGGWSGRDWSCARHGYCCLGSMDGRGGRWRWRRRKMQCTAMGRMRERERRRKRGQEAGRKAERPKRPNNIHIHYDATASKQGFFLHPSHAKWQPVTVNLCSQPFKRHAKIWLARQKTDDVTPKP